MRLFQALSNWQTARQEKHRAAMESAGKCPDCRGYGFTPIYDAIYIAPYDCTGCNGSGLYADWAQNQTADAYTTALPDDSSATT